MGINPSLTISCLAERCMRLLAEKEGWKIDYDTFKPLGKIFSSRYNLCGSDSSSSSSIRSLRGRCTKGREGEVELEHEARSLG